MNVPAPDLRNKSIPELLLLLGAGEAGSPMHRQASIMLQFRIAEKQVEAAIRQAATSDSLVEAIGNLAAFTRALVKATWALFFVGGVALLLTLVQAAAAWPAFWKVVRP